MPAQSRVVGRVIKAHGLHGELIVEPSTDNVELRFAAGVVLRLDASPGAITIRGARQHGGRLLVTVEEVDGRDDADALRGAVLSADALDEAPEDPEEFHDHQLEGLRAELADGTVVGTVTDVTHGAGGELLVLARPGGGQALIPFVTAIVPQVDLAGGRLVLDPPEGLLE